MIPGDILLYPAPNRFLRWLMRFFTMTHYGHAALYVGEIHGIPVIVEAGARGVVLNRLYGEPEVWRVDVSEEERERAVIKALAKLGRGYNFLQLFGFVISWLTCSKWNPFNSRERYICSELINAAYDYRLGRRGVTSPGTLARSNLTRRVM